MSYYYPLLLYLGSGGGLLLLAASAVSRLRALRKPLSAVWVTAMALVWALSPATARWVLSVWGPGRVAGGLLVLDIQSAVWWCVLLILVAGAGILWLTVSERREDIPLAGMLLVIALTVVWLGLASGSLLMLLTMWAVFDVIWFVARLVSGADEERVIWATALNGIASLVLWVASLFLLRSGDTELWWLARPPSSVLALLYVAGLIRVGFYPFQVGHMATPRASSPLALVSVIGPVMGVALLYRLVSLPGGGGAPAWVIGWGCISVLWSGIKALSQQGRRAVLAAVYGMLLAVVTGALASSRSDLLTIGTGVWVVASALLLVSRPRRGSATILALPALCAVVALVGAPPSPLLGSMTGVLSGRTSTVELVMYFLGLALIVGALLRGLQWRPPDRYDDAVAIRFVGSRVAGWLLLVGILVAASLRVVYSPLASWAFALWLAAVIVGAALARWVDPTRLSWSRARPWVELLDLTWLHRATWQGAENALGVLRATADVVEGSASVLWSVLILLLALLVIGSR